MDNLYQEELEKSADKKEVNVSLDDDGIMKVLMCCHAGRSCRECPYDELDSPRCRDILLNECIGLINRLKAEKMNVAREILEEIEEGLDKYYDERVRITNPALFNYRIQVANAIHELRMSINALKKRYTEEGK